MYIYIYTSHIWNHNRNNLWNKNDIHIILKTQMGIQLLQEWQFEYICLVN